MTSSWFYSQLWTTELQAHGPPHIPRSQYRYLETRNLCLSPSLADLDVSCCHLLNSCDWFLAPSFSRWSLRREWALSRQTALATACSQPSPFLNEVFPRKWAGQRLPHSKVQLGLTGFRLATHWANYPSNLQMVIWTSIPDLICLHPWGKIEQMDTILTSF